MLSVRWVGSERGRTIAAAIAWAATSAAMLYRLPFGTPEWDEPYYSAMPYSFLLGNHPYVDELGAWQNAGILLMPFYRMYLAIAGSADGIILFNRYLYFAYVSVASLAAYSLVKRIASPVTACCVGALVATFSYFNLLALGYNTVGALGLFCGMLCTGCALLKPRPGPTLFGASLLFLSAMFAYPTLTVVVAVYLVIVLAWLFFKTPRAARINGLLGLGAGLVPMLLVFSVLAVQVGRAGFERLLAFSNAMGYGGGTLAKLNVFHAAYQNWHWIPFAFAGLYLALPLVCLWLKRHTWLIALATAVGFTLCYRLCLGVFSLTAATLSVGILPILAPVCVALNRSWKYGPFVLALFWAPSVASMLTVTCTSAMWYQGLALSALGSTLAGVVSLAAYLETRARRSPEQRPGYQLVFASFFVSLLVIQVHSLFAKVYGEIQLPLAAYDTLVRSGPMRGTRGPKAEVDFLENVDRDLKSVEPGAQTITVLDYFPTGYLSTRLRPRTFTHWIMWFFLPLGYAAEMSRETFGSPEKLPDIFLIVHADPRFKSYYEKYIHRHYKAIIRRPEFDYVILRKLPKRALRHRKPR